MLKQTYRPLALRWCPESSGRLTVDTLLHAPPTDASVAVACETLRGGGHPVLLGSTLSLGSALTPRYNTKHDDLASHPVVRDGEEGPVMPPIKMVLSTNQGPHQRPFQSLESIDAQDRREAVDRGSRRLHIHRKDYKSVCPSSEQVETRIVRRANTGRAVKLELELSFDPLGRPIDGQVDGTGPSGAPSVAPFDGQVDGGPLGRPPSVASIDDQVDGGPLGEKWALVWVTNLGRSHHRRSSR